MNQKKLFIFDFDGVILDTEKYHFLSWKAVMVPFVDLQWAHYEPLKSMGRDKILREFEAMFGLSIDAACADALKAEKGVRYNQLIGQLSKDDLIGGVLAYLNQLKQANCLTAVASSSLMAHQLLKNYDMMHLFDLVLDANANLAPKPNPDIFLTCAAQLQVAARDCVVFEDSAVGVMAASSAAIDCVYVGQLSHPQACYAVKDFTDARLQQLI